MTVIAVFGLLIYYLKAFSYGLLLAVCFSCAWIIMGLARIGFTNSNCGTDSFFQQVCDYPWYFNGWAQASFFVPAIVACLWWAYHEWNDTYY
jgi:ABC-type microcin C transport system permease subunit YejB